MGLGFRDLGFRDLGFRDLGLVGLGFRGLQVTIRLSPPLSSLI